MLHTKYQWIPAIGSWEEDFWRFIKKKILILPLIGPQNGPASLVEQIWIPIPQACFLPSLVEIGLVVLEKKSLKWKSWRRTDGRRTLRHGITSHGLRPGELKRRHKWQDSMNFYEIQRWNQVLRKGKHFLLPMRPPSFCPLCRINE